MFFKIKGIAFALACLSLWSCRNQPAVADKTEINYGEVERFYNILALPDTTARKEALYKHFLDSAQNPAAHQIYNMTLARDGMLWKRFKKVYRYLKSMKPHSLRMVRKKYAKIDEYYLAFKKMYPRAHHPKIRFTTGVLTVGGTVTEDGLVISTEFYGKNKPGVDTINLPIPKEFLFDNEDEQGFFNTLILHEHMHYEQRKNVGEALSLAVGRTSLLDAAMTEGAADFVANLVTRGFENRPNYVYGRAHEKELWAKLQQEMRRPFHEVAKDWMYNYRFQKDPGRIDLGYFMGAQICKSYYDHAQDKAQAIEDILSITDSEGFLEKSKYAAKFK